MAKTNSDINKLRAERAKGLFDWWKEHHPEDKKSQQKLAVEMGISPIVLSAKLNNHRTLTEEDARKIAHYFPGVRVEFILGFDEYRTLEEYQKQFTKYMDSVNSACLTLLDSAVNEVCLRENIKPPKLDNIPELLLLEAQLKDYAVSLMWNYIRWRSCSYVWGGYLDQIGKPNKAERQGGKENGKH